MDPYIVAENVLATFGGPVVRNLRNKIVGAKFFKRVGMAPPVAKDQRVPLVEGEAQSTPLIALYLHAGGGLGAPHVPPTNHDLSTRHTTQRAIGMAKDKSILMQTQTETDRNATTRLRLFVRPEEMGGGRIIARHAYRYINEHFAPGMGDKVSYNSVNCFYPFMDASVYQGSPGTSTTPPAFGGYVKIDYALPTPIAKVLMQSITSHEFFTKGTVFAIPLTAIADENSYFVIPTRDAMRGFVGDYNPVETLNAVLGQQPGGRGTITLLGTSIKSATSVIFRADISGVAPEEGLTREQTLSKSLFYDGGLLMYRASDATLVRHVPLRNPWKLPPVGAHVHDAPSFPNLPGGEDGSHHVYITAHVEELEAQIRKAAALLGTYKSFTRCMGARVGEHAFIVDYENEESKVLAHAFHLEGVRFTPRGSSEELATKKAALITLDPQVDETDRMLSAVITVGSQFGSREQMARIKEKESLLLERATTFDFAAWRAELAAPKDPRVSRSLLITFTKWLPTSTTKSALWKPGWEARNPTIMIRLLAKHPPSTPPTCTPLPLLKRFCRPPLVSPPRGVFPRWRSLLPKTTRLASSSTSMVNLGLKLEIGRFANSVTRMTSKKGLSRNG